MHGFMRRVRPVMALGFLATTLVAFAAAGCGGAAPTTSPGATWTPAPRLTASPTSFRWSQPIHLRGRLMPEAWTSTAPFLLPAGPATVVGILKLSGSTWPRFAARLVPVHHPAAFAGYVLAGAGLWHLPNITAGEGALAGWFPYALPAGSYRLMVRRVGAAQAVGTYDLWLAGVKTPSPSASPPAADLPPPWVQHEVAWQALDAGDAHPRPSVSGPALRSSGRTRWRRLAPR